MILLTLTTAPFLLIWGRVVELLFSELMPRFVTFSGSQSPLRYIWQIKIVLYEDQEKNCRQCHQAQKIYWAIELKPCHWAQRFTKPSSSNCVIKHKIYGAIQPNPCHRTQDYLSHSAQTVSSNTKIYWAIVPKPVSSDTRFIETLCSNCYPIGYFEVFHVHGISPLKKLCTKITTKLHGISFLVNWKQYELLTAKRCCESCIQRSDSLCWGQISQERAAFRWPHRRPVTTDFSY